MQDTHRYLPITNAESHRIRQTPLGRKELSH